MVLCIIYCFLLWISKKKLKVALLLISFVPLYPTYRSCFKEFGLRSSYEIDSLTPTKDPDRIAQWQRQRLEGPTWISTQSRSWSRWQTESFRCFKKNMNIHQCSMDLCFHFHGAAKKEEPRNITGITRQWVIKNRPIWQLGFFATFQIPNPSLLLCSGGVYYVHYTFMLNDFWIIYSVLPLGTCSDLVVQWENERTFLFY